MMILLVLVCILCPSIVQTLSPPLSSHPSAPPSASLSRTSFLRLLPALVTLPSQARAADDLGELAPYDKSTDLQSTTVTTSSPSSSYTLPSKWSPSPSGGFTDKSRGGAACSGPIRVVSLDPSTVPTSLDGDVPTLCALFSLSPPPSSAVPSPKAPYKNFDLINARTRTEGRVTFKDYDLAYAPSKCPDTGGVGGASLGLGFCPYERIYFCSLATSTGDTGEEKAAAFLVEASAAEYRVGSGDLRTVRESWRT